MLAYLGKMRIFVRSNIRTLPIENPQIRILPPAYVIISIMKVQNSMQGKFSVVPVDTLLILSYWNTGPTGKREQTCHTANNESESITTLTEDHLLWFSAEQQ